MTGKGLTIRGNRQRRVASELGTSEIFWVYGIRHRAHAFRPTMPTLLIISARQTVQLGVKLVIAARSGAGAAVQRGEARERKAPNNQHDEPYLEITFRGPRFRGQKRGEARQLNARNSHCLSGAGKRADDKCCTTLVGRGKCVL